LILKINSHINTIPIIKNPPNTISQFFKLKPKSNLLTSPVAPTTPEGISLLTLTERIEQKIKSLGAEPAFPVQISCNETAAHFCPKKDDKIILEKLKAV